jgi:O-antigen/teichoic acid export membrane protein
MLFRSVAQSVAAIAKFQSWQALVHFGADPYERDDLGSVRRLWLKLAAIDFVVGLAAMTLGGAFVLSFASTVSIPTDLAHLAATYCLIVPLQVAGTPTGILRLTDRFDLMAWQSLVTPGVRLIGVCVAYLLGAPLWAVVAAWVVSDILGDAFLWVCALAVARGKSLLQSKAESTRSAASGSVLWRYLLGTNFNASLQQGALPLLTLAIGGVLGPSAAGAYRLAQTLLDAVLAPAELAMRSLFPEISKLQAAKGERLNEIMRHVGLTSLWVSIPAGAILFLGAGIFVNILAGEEYSGAGSLLSVLAWTLPALFVAAICESFLLGSGRAVPAGIARAAIVGLSVMAIFVFGNQMSLVDLGLALRLASDAGLLVRAVPTLVMLRRQQKPASAD